MRFMEKVIGLAVTNLIWFIVLCIYGVVVNSVFPVMNNAANGSGIYGQVHPIYNNIVMYGWIGLIIFGLGSLAYLLVSSHQDEYEQYTNFDQQMNDQYNQR